MSMWGRRGRAMGVLVGTSMVAACLAATGPAAVSQGAASVAAAAPVTDSAWDHRFGLPGTGMDVTAVAEDGANLYVGGSFHTVAGQPFGSHEYIARWDGQRWHKLGTGLDGPVTAIAVDSAHRVYVAGDFTTAGGAPASRIAMWNGTTWQALGSGITSTSIFEAASVSVLLADGTDLYVGGKFDRAGGVSVDSLARWNPGTGTFSNVGGGVQECFFCGDGGVSGEVHALAKNGSTLFVGGYFNLVNRTSPQDAGSVAAWNGSSWSVLGGGAAGEFGMARVEALAHDGTRLYAGGDFTSIGGTAAPHLARWSGTAWSALGSGDGLQHTGTIPAVHALEVASDGLYLGGAFDHVDGKPIDSLARFDGSTWTSVGDPGTVTALDRRAAGGVHVGGMFGPGGGKPFLGRVGTFDGSRWFVLGQGAVLAPGLHDPETRAIVRAFAAGPDGEYAAGTFHQLGDAASGGVARWDGTRWQPLGTGLARDGGAHGYAVASIGDDVFVGGSFTRAGGTAAANIARWNPDTGWSSIGGTNGAVRALTVLGGKLYAGGAFTVAGGKAVSQVARFDPATGSWSALPGPVGADVLALAPIYDRYLAVGGKFGQVTTAEGTVRTGGLLIFDTQTGAWLPPSSVGNGVVRVLPEGEFIGHVNALAVVGNDLFVGGGFDKTAPDYLGTSMTGRGLARIDLTTSRWEPVGQVGGRDGTAEVLGLAAAGHQLWVGGHFDTAGGVNSPGIARLDTTTGGWSAAGSALATSGTPGRVHGLGLAPGELWVGGEFTHAGAVAAASVSRLRQPPGVLLTQQPPAVTSATTASFAFQAVPAGPGVSFTCSLDGGVAQPCTSPRNLTGLAPGAHSLTVTATDATGTGLPAVARWTIATPPVVTLGGATPAEGAWSGRSVRLDFSADQPGVPTTFECSLDGGPWNACGSGATLTSLSGGEHSVSIRATNAAGTGPQVTRTWRVDATGATTSMTRPGTTAFTLSTTLPFAWASTDAGSGASTWAARWRRAPYNAGFGALTYSTSWQALTTPRVNLSGGRPGSTYCTSARARDRVGNWGGWATERCWAMPLDDRSLARSAGWTTGTGSASYRGTHTTTTRLGATLTRTSAQGRRYALVATRCRTCGTVGIYSGATLLKKVNLYRATTQRKYVVTWLGGYRSGTLTLRVLSSGKTVQIDGFGVSRS